MIRLLPLRTTGLYGNVTSTFHPLLMSAPALKRSASLSAIHRGLRKSERAQYGEARSSETPTRRRSKYDNNTLTEKALEGAKSKRQQFKLLRKLRRKQEEIDGTGKKTRRKRFADPSLDFGKNSLVYQIKHGSLKDLTGKIDEPVRPRPLVETRRKDWVIRDAIAGRTPLAKTKERPQKSRQLRRRDDEGDGRSRDSPRGAWGDETGARQRDAPRDRPRDNQRRQHEPRMSGDNGETTGVFTPAPRPRKGNMMPLTIKYTTAASQFLYGKSVVKAALDHARRKLYNLYIYAGESRQDSRDIGLMRSLARKRGVPVTMVPNEDQRLMDKMSTGRPHNGFVLEASPLPQLPITSLQSVEELESGPGFHVGLDYQTKEEEAINGTATFVQRSSNTTAQPLVLLLHEVMDPGNLGALLRTASYFGVDAIGITNRNSSTLTPVVLKSAAGAVEEISIFTVDSPAKFLEESRKAGWRSYAAVPPPDQKLVAMHDGKFVSAKHVEKTNPLAEHPCILVLGNEGFGLPKQVKVASDFELSVPQFVQGSCVDSLNVSVAAGLLCHSFVKESHANQDAQLEGEKADDVLGGDGSSESSEPRERGVDYMF